MNEIWNIFKEAKNASIKVLSHVPQEVTNSELESLFRAYWYYSKDPNQLDSSPSSKNLLEAMDAAVDSFIETFVDILKDWKPWFLGILIEDILNWKTTLKSIFDDPYKLLSESSDPIEINDDESKSTLNDLIKAKINEELLCSDFSKDFDPLQLTDLQKILKGVNSMNYISRDVKQAIDSGISKAMFWKISPELEEISKDFWENIEKAIKNWDSSFDAQSYKKKFIETVREVENDKVVRWSSAEELLKKCKKSFEELFDKSVWGLISVIIEWKLSDELENFDSELDIDNYTRSSQGTVYSNITNLLSELGDKNIKSELEKKLKDKIAEASLVCKSRPPKVRITTDEAWNQSAHFSNEYFPVAKRDPKKPIWRIVPKKLPDGNVLITFKDPASGKVIEPSPGRKRLRAENPYEMSPKEYMQLDRQIAASNKILRDIADIKEKLNTTTDESERKELNKKLHECIEKIPHFIKVRDKLKIFDKYIWDYVQDKVPDFNPDVIKITPDIMENLREIAECSRNMLIWEKDALVIQWEAWVWKNVLIDIFAHFTNRPVFVFACGKKTDSHDLNYQWILDESGSKKLNSKVYEAIRTPWAILVLDEINTLDAWVIKTLNGLFDKRKSLVSPEAGSKDTKALTDVLLFGTMNPAGYAWTQQIPQDVASRFHFIEHDYDWIFDKDGWVSYSDALRTYWNVNYFWKLATWNGMRKKDVELYEDALIDKRVWNKLTKEKQEILEKFKPISDTDFIWAWNQLFNMNNKQAVLDKFWSYFVEWMKDIYEIVVYSNYIRMRHKIAKLRIEGDFPWDEDSNQYFEEKSFSPRLVIQALEQFNNGNEISSPKEAVIQTYVQQVSDTKKHAEIIQFLNSLSRINFNRLGCSDIEQQLKNEEVRKVLFKNSTKSD